MVTQGHTSLALQAIISASPQPGHTSEGDSSSSPHTVYMLFPAFPDGSLADELARLEQARAKAAGTGGAGKGAVTMTVPPTGHPGGVVLPTSEVLSIFRQVASGLAAMHEAGYAHRDVKPHNVLIRRPQPGGSRPGAGQLGHHPALPAATASIQAGTIVDAAQEAQLAASQALLPQQPQQPQHQQQQQQQHSAGSLLQVAGRALGAVQSVHSTALGKPRPLQLGAYQALPISEQQDGEGTSAGYTAVLMDFGSARARAVNVVNRSQALLLQEEAEVRGGFGGRGEGWKGG
jgi:serine/threonine protein kinase